VTVTAADVDRDGLADPFDNCPQRPNADQRDVDADGVGDRCDLEGPDADSDGRPDPLDNCLEEANPSQRDADSDGFGNACDPDYTNDGIVDASDLTRLATAFGSGSGSDRFDEALDSNGDGAIGGSEFLALGHSFGRGPGPSGLPCAGVIPCLP
jgi:hypothetical protein